jgi:uncharacterized protein (TIGR02265 family)
MADGNDTLAVDSSLFEALFRVKPPDEALTAQLHALGIDAAHLASHYRAAQWRAVVELYRHHLFPDDLGSVGHRKLGLALANAFGGTLTGRLLAATLPLLNPMQLLRRWPRFVRMGRTDVTLNVVELGERSVRLESFDPVDVPMEVNFGLLEYCFERMGERVELKIVSHEAEQYVVHCSW